MYDGWYVRVGSEVVDFVSGRVREVMLGSLAWAMLGRVAEVMLGCVADEVARG